MNKLSIESAKKLMGWESNGKDFPEMPNEKEMLAAGCTNEEIREATREWILKSEEPTAIQAAAIAISNSCFGNVTLIGNPAFSTYGRLDYDNRVAIVTTYDLREFKVCTRTHKILEFDAQEREAYFDSDAEPNIVAYWLVLDEAQEKAATCLN
jgi:hypothetical protein